MSSDHHHFSEKPNKYIVTFVLLLSIAGIWYSFSKGGSGIIEGRVVSVLSEKDTVFQIGEKEKIIREQNLLVEINTSSGKSAVKAINDYRPVEKGDTVFLRKSNFGESEFSVDNVSRAKELIILSVFFILLVVATTGLKGFYSLIGLLFSFAVIFSYIVPQILSGFSPVLAGVSGAALILVPALYLSYGYNKKSIAAFLGIISSLVFVGIISSYFIDSLGFVGGGEESMYLDIVSSNAINFVGLIIAGIIISAVGVLDDVAAIQSSIVFSLASHDENLKGYRLFKKAMSVGRDHIAAVVNTLVLAYTGASLPLLLLISLDKVSANYFASLEIVAEEIARTLISSSGLLLAVPLTTLIAVMMAKNKKSDIKS